MHEESGTIMVYSTPAGEIRVRSTKIPTEEDQVLFVRVYGKRAKAIVFDVAIEPNQARELGAALLTAADSVDPQPRN